MIIESHFLTPNDKLFVICLLDSTVVVFLKESFKKIMYANCWISFCLRQNVNQSIGGYVSAFTFGFNLPSIMNGRDCLLS